MRANLPFPFYTTLSRHEVCLCSLFSLICLLIGLCASSLPEIGGSSEAREAHVIKLMTQQSDYVLPSRNGIIPSKPPLFHWIGVSVSQMIGRFTPFTARIPSVLAGFVVLWIVMALAAELGGEDVCRRVRLMIWAGIVLSTSYLFEKMRTVAMVDMVFCLCVTLALAPIIHRLLIRCRQGLRPDPSTLCSIDYSAFFLFAGMAVLAKGPIGFVLSVVLVAPFLAIDRSARSFVVGLLRPRIGWVLFLLIALPWYLLAASRHSQAFIGKQLLFENLQRLTGGEHVNTQPWWYYLPAFLRSSLPWSFVFIAGIKVWFFRLAVERGGLRGLPEAFFRAIYQGILLALILFSIASGKRESYLLPLLPLLALASAPLVIEGIDSLSVQWRVRMGQVVSRTAFVFALLLALCVGCVEFAARLGLYPASPLLALVQQWLVLDLPIVSLAAVLALAVVPLSRRLVPGGEFESAAQTLTLLTVLSISLAVGVSIRSHLKNFKPVANQVEQQIHGEPLQVVRILRDEFFDGILYYLNSPVTLVAPDDFTRLCQGFALVRYDQWRSFEHTEAMKAVERISVYTEIDDQLSGREDNQKILIKCPDSSAR